MAGTGSAGRSSFVMPTISPGPAAYSLVGELEGAKRKVRLSSPCTAAPRRVCRSCSNVATPRVAPRVHRATRSASRSAPCTRGAPSACATTGRWRPRRRWARRCAAHARIHVPGRSPHPAWLTSRTSRVPLAPAVSRTGPVRRARQRQPPVARAPHARHQVWLWVAAGEPHLHLQAARRGRGLWPRLSGAHRVQPRPGGAGQRHVALQEAALDGLLHQPALQDDVHDVLEEFSVC